MLPSWLTDPLWIQFEALLPERPVLVPTHPLGCHRRRISDRMVFDKLLQLLRFGCSYEAVADSSCSATTIRNRRDEWIALGVFARFKQIALAAYDRITGLVLDQIAIDGSITKAPGGGEASERSPVDRGEHGTKRSGMTDGYGIPLGWILAGANRHDSPLLESALDLLKDLGSLPDDITVHLDAGCDSGKTHATLDERGLHGQIAHKGDKPRSRPTGGGTSNALTPGRTPSLGWPAATNAARSSSMPSSTSPTRSSPSAASCGEPGSVTAGTDDPNAVDEPARPRGLYAAMSSSRQCRCARKSVDAAYAAIRLHDHAGK